MADLGRPDPETWRRRYMQADQFQHAWRAEAVVEESLYEQTWEVDNIPEDIPITIPSTARAIIDEATDHSDFDPSYLTVHLPTLGMDQDAEVLAGRMKNFYEGWLIYQLTRANDVSPYRDWVKNQFLNGKAVYKVVADHMEWPMLELKEGDRKSEEALAKKQLERDREWVMPIVLRSLNPMAVFEDPSIGQKRWAIEEYEHEWQEIQPLYEHWIPEGLLDVVTGSVPPDARVRIWDCYQIGEVDGVKGLWHQVLINENLDTGPVVSPADPRTKGPTWLPNEPFPYIVRFSGLGRQSSGKYEHKARGILYGVKDLIKEEARRGIQLGAIVSALAWPTLFVTGPRARFNVEYGPNKINYVPPGVTVDTVTPTIPTGPIQASLATLQAGIERGTFGSVIRGDKPPQTTSAAQLAILSGQARLRFGSVKIQHEAALWEVLQKVAIIAKDVFKAPLTIWQTDDTDEANDERLVLDPDDIPEKLRCRVEILTDPVEEQDRRVQLAHFLYQDGVIDIEEYRERAGIRDTAAMRRRQLRDRVLLESPGILQALGENLLLESGYDLESTILEKSMRDMLILRRQREMQQALLGAGPGGANPAGSQPAQTQTSPNPLGGSPGTGAVVPTPQQATQAAQEPVSG